MNIDGKNPLQNLNMKMEKQQKRKYKVCIPTALKNLVSIRQQKLIWSQND